MKPYKRKVKMGKYKGWTIIDPAEPIDIRITEADIRKAVCRDPAKCVIAQAVKRQLAMCGEVSGLEVGSVITKIFIEERKIIFRYGTPKPLATGLKAFDETGEWPLEEGIYKLNPTAPSYRRGSRWHKKKKGGTGKQSKPKHEIKFPTRRTTKYTYASV